jgi:peptide deformylase
MIRGVKIYGNPTLREKSKPIEKIDSQVRQLAEDMLETMYHYNGVGLAGPQVGISLRIITVDSRDPEMGPQVLINPKIIDRDGSISGEEGCLSLPNIYASVQRARKVRITYTDIEGKERTEEWRDMPARIAQHEIDHLNGVLFVDRIDEAQKEGLREQLKNLKQERKELERVGPKIVEKGRGI